MSIPSLPSLTGGSAGPSGSIGGATGGSFSVGGFKFGFWGFAAIALIGAVWLYKKKG